MPIVILQSPDVGDMAGVMADFIQRSQSVLFNFLYNPNSRGKRHKSHKVTVAGDERRKII